MSSLTYNTYPGAGEELTNLFNYSQSVAIPASALIIKLAGQGGWSPSSFFELPGPPSDEAAHKTQVKQAFDNVERALAAAGVAEGWKAVYCMRSYSVDIGKTQEAITEELKARCGEGHKPIWTALGVRALASEEMLVEIEVEAVLQQK
ncbi:hypothetical protein JCM6882_007859 [Rhodosporidiobolus microsporus]